MVEPCGATYEALMLREAPNRLTMIDPNIRPSFIRDETTYRARLTRMMGAADIIKTSDEDLEWIVGNADANALLASTGAQVILLTRGGDGVSIVTADGTYDVAAEKAQVVDTVGAGDTFSAGFMAQLHKSGHLTKERHSRSDRSRSTCRGRLWCQGCRNHRQPRRRQPTMDI
jgi:fructokinase